MSENRLQFQCPRIIIGNGAIDQIGEEARGLGATRPLVITDRGVEKAGLVEKLRQGLSGSRLDMLLFADVEPDPPLEIVERCLTAVKGERFDCVIGIGGGSSLDTAKVVALIAGIGGRLSDYIGIDKVPAPGLPTILAPTTAGTGSEVSPIAVFSDHAEKLKKAVVSRHIYGSLALVDPLLALSLPPRLTAATGMDALCHAVETYTSLKSTPFTDCMALESLRLVGEHLAEAVDHGDQKTARLGMATASLLAGLNLATAGTGAAHALAYPLGGIFAVPHSAATSLLLPYVMDFNDAACASKHHVVARALKGDREEGDRGAARDMAPARSRPRSREKTSSRPDVKPKPGVKPKQVAGAEAVRWLAGRIGMPERLRDLGIPRASIPELAEGAMKVTRLLANNPRPVALADAVGILEAAW